MKKARILTDIVRLLFLFTSGLVVFKFIGLVDWSWWTVFSPIWFPALIIFSITLVVGIIAICYVGYVALVGK